MSASSFFHALATNRRGFVGAFGTAGLGVLLAKTASAVTVGPLNPTQRRDRAFQIRSDPAAPRWDG